MPEVSMVLLREYIWNGVRYGPGRVTVPDEAAASDMRKKDIEFVGTPDYAIYLRRRASTAGAQPFMSLPQPIMPSQQPQPFVPPPSQEPVELTPLPQPVIDQLNAQMSGGEGDATPDDIAAIEAAARAQGIKPPPVALEQAAPKETRRPGDRADVDGE